MGSPHPLSSPCTGLVSQPPTLPRYGDALPTVFLGNGEGLRFPRLQLSSAKHRATWTYVGPRCSLAKDPPLPRLSPAQGQGQAPSVRQSAPSQKLSPAPAPNGRGIPVGHHERANELVPAEALAQDRDRLRLLIAELAAAQDDVERDAILLNDPQVRALFPRASSGVPGGGSSGVGRFVRPAVRLAMAELAPDEVRLLMVMVAAGQGHLLDTPLDWGEQEEEEGQLQGQLAEAPMAEGVKGALSVLASMIEGWQKEGKEEAPKAPLNELLGRFQKGVFSNPVLELFDQERKQSSSHSTSSSSSSSTSSSSSSSPASSSGQTQLLTFGQGDPSEFLAQFLDAFDNPGVFPVPILEMFDIEGRSSVAGLDAWLRQGGVGGLGLGLGLEGQGHRVNKREHAVRELRSLVGMLRRLEKFYDGVGGILGYQAVTLDLICQEEECRARAGAGAEAEAESQSVGDAARAEAEGQKEGAAEGELPRFSMPPGADLAADPEYALRAALWGLEGLPAMAEMYPLGGAGDRLGLVDPVTGEPLPVAMLHYCGRTLLEGLIRDLQAREYLHFRVFGEQHITPVAIMTSAAKRNNARVHALCEAAHWFGRGRGSFVLFEQPLVPAVAAADGRWPAGGPLRPVLKPGGHGVMWKLAADEGVLHWLTHTHRRKAALIRQISNIISGTDVTLLSLSGVGLKGNKKFGFASCDRNMGAAEGVNVLAERRTGGGQWQCGITCVEYTEFQKLGIADMPKASGSTKAQLPANTNVLFANLDAVRNVVHQGNADEDTPSTSNSATRNRAHRGGGVGGVPGAGLAALPGMILNLKKPLTYYDSTGRLHSVRAGRLECTMQNIADSLTTPLPHSFSEHQGQREQEQQGRLPLSPEGAAGGDEGSPSGADGSRGSAGNVAGHELDTFLVYNSRRKVTSSAKRRRKPSDLNMHQTPEGSFLDLNRNARELFLSCGVRMPEMETNECYADTFPPFILLFHPALGPLWEVIRQKVKGGSISGGSEVCLEVAELAWTDVHVDGSLLVEAENVMGSPEPNDAGEPVLRYGHRCGRCRMQGVTVRNKGVFWEHPDNLFWQHRVVRHESLRIVLHGDAEFHARNVTIEGSHVFEVPEGCRMTVTTDWRGKMVTRVEKLRNGHPSWTWHITAKWAPEERPGVSLKIVES